MTKWKHASLSKHHILPTSRGGSNEEVNVQTIKDKLHRNIHALFENLVIKEKILYTTKLDSKALDPKFVKELLYVLEWFSNEECYKDNVIGSDTFISDRIEF